METRKVKFLILIALSMTFSSFQTSNPRRLILFGKDHASFQAQLQLLSKDSLGFSERDLKIEMVDFENALTKKYHVKLGQLTVILIGRDGEEKYRTNSPVSAQTLFDVIDSMPMRQAETRKKSN